jgi:glycosyltransferase involved in cell wall biosynthesis
VPTTDVLMPVRNGVSFLAQSIESIVAQTCTDWRLLVLDHGSTDGSAELAARYAERDGRIKLLSLPEVPHLAALLNAGLEHCDCRYVMRHDADDIALPNRMALMNEFFEVNAQYVAAGGEAIMIDSQGRDLDHLRPPASSRAVTAASFFYNPVIHPAVTINFHAFRKLGAFYGGDFLGVLPAAFRARRPAPGEEASASSPDPFTVNRLAEDYILFGQLAILGLCANIPAPLIKYRRHGNSVGIANHAAQIEASLKVSRFLSKSFSLMNRTEAFDPGPFCNHADYVFDFERRDYSAQFERMARSLWRGLGPSPELARELAFRRVLAKRKYTPMMVRFMEFEARYAAQPPERRTVRNWLLRNIRHNRYIYRPAPCQVN